jgi:hypothetical protein
MMMNKRVKKRRRDMLGLVCRMKSMISTERGAGLTESLISVAIAAIAITAILSALSTGSMAVQRSDKNVTAENIARSQMELIQGEPFYPFGTYGILDPIPDGYSVAVEVSTVEDRPMMEIQKVTVTVNYDEKDLILESVKVNR